MKQNNLVPSPLSSDHEYYRFHHIDLPDLDDTHLTDELYYLRPCLREHHPTTGCENEWRG